MESLGLRLLDNWMKYKWPVGFKGYFLMQQQKTAKQQQLGVGSPKPVDGKFSLSRDFSLPFVPAEDLPAKLSSIRGLGTWKEGMDHGRESET